METRMTMTKPLLIGLVAVNVLLGAALGLRLAPAVLDRPAAAQLGGGGALQVVGGQVRGDHIIFVLNQTTGELTPYQINASQGKHVALDRASNVAKDLQQYIK
jgi:hypothetical protein